MFLFRLAEVLKSTRNDDQEPSGRHCCVALEGRVPDPGVVVHHIDGDGCRSFRLPCLVSGEGVLDWVVRKGCCNPTEFRGPLFGRVNGLVDRL